MNQPLQTAALANLIVASRLPSEGNFRRDAILGAMVGQVNPMAGALVAIRSADSLTALIRERDALKAGQPGTPVPSPVLTPAPTGGAPTPSAPAPTPAAGAASPAVPWPSTLDEENRKALQALLRQLIQAAMTWAEILSPPSTGTGNPAALSDLADDDASRKFQEAARDVAAALTSIAAEARSAVINQDENQAMMRQVLERMVSSGSGGTAPSSGSTSSGSTAPSSGGKGKAE
jgi:hypothetical protein